MKKIFPHPLASTVLLLVWMLLTRFSLGMLIIGGLVAMAAGLVMTRLQMPAVHIHNWRKVLQLAGIVAVDIVRSNIAVAQLILQGSRAKRKRAGFLEIKLEIRDRHALAVLAIIITSTPGTAWMEYDPVSGRLLLHVLDLVDEDAWRELIRNRYEALLLEIFE